MITSTPSHSVASTPLRLLVVGGAGYIGSHMVKHLMRRGCDVVTFDNLSTGRRDAVFHFASFIQVGESVKEPTKYYANSVANTLILLDAMVAHGVRRFVFSSTAAVYGEPAYTPINEAHPKQPINPYGKTKWMVEQILEDYERAHGRGSIALRYFNAAGADPEGQLGERHDPETHLIPLVLQATSGHRPHISVFGCDYDTPDSTGIRDCIHIADLADADWLALDKLLQGAGSAAYKLGNGNGFSVQQVIDTAASVTGRAIPVVDAPRRDGDPARLVADATRARQELNWQPARDSLDVVIEDTWRWESSSRTH